MHVGIVGSGGVVGSAVVNACQARKIDYCGFDKYRPNANKNEKDIYDTDLAFVCVPTPTYKQGQDLAELHASLKDLSEHHYHGVVVVKSTVLPGTMNDCKILFPNLRLVHNPEFLSQLSAHEDFIKQPAVLLSGKSKDTKFVAAFIRDFLGYAIPIEASADFKVTEFAKYAHNLALAVKLSFLNEIHAACGDQETFDHAILMASYFGNLGDNCKVPGPDSKMGWGGFCFPKDSLAFVKLYPAPTLQGAIETNTKLRPDEMTLREKYETKT